MQLIWWCEVGDDTGDIVVFFISISIFPLDAMVYIFRDRWRREYVLTKKEIQVIDTCSLPMAIGLASLNNRRFYQTRAIQHLIIEA